MSSTGGAKCTTTSAPSGVLAIHRLGSTSRAVTLPPSRRSSHDCMSSRVTIGDSSFGVCPRHNVHASGRPRFVPHREHLLRPPGEQPLGEVEPLLELHHPELGRLQLAHTHL